MAQTARIPTGELKQTLSATQCSANFLGTNGQNSNRGIETGAGCGQGGDPVPGTNGQNSNRGIETKPLEHDQYRLEIAQTARIPTGELKPLIHKNGADEGYSTNGQNSNRGIETLLAVCRWHAEVLHKRPEFQPGN